MMMYYTQYLIKSGLGMVQDHSGFKPQRRTVMQKAIGVPSNPFLFLYLEMNYSSSIQSFGIKALSFLHFSTTDD